MKCICGYVHESKVVNGEWQENYKGDTEFCEITGSTFKISNVWDDNYEITLYACPKCGTIKTEEFFLKETYD